MMIKYLTSWLRCAQNSNTWPAKNIRVIVASQHMCISIGVELEINCLIILVCKLFFAVKPDVICEAELIPGPPRQRHLWSDEIFRLDSGWI